MKPILMQGLVVFLTYYALGTILSLFKIYEPQLMFGIGLTLGNILINTIKYQIKKSKTKESV